MRGKEGGKGVRTTGKGRGGGKLGRNFGNLAKDKGLPFERRFLFS